MYFIKITSIILLLGGFWELRAQESVNCFGADGSGSGGSVAISVGQVAYTYQSGSNGQVNQGVQQAAVCSLCTQLQTGDCGAVGVTADQTLRAINVYAPQYRFRITGPNNNGAGWNNGSFLVVSPNRSFKFSSVPGVVWGQTYSVAVATGDGLGNFEPYGNACNVALAIHIPTTQLEASSCGATDVALNTTLRAVSVQNAIGYRFHITGVNNGGSGWVGNVFTLDRTTRDFKFNMVPGAVLGQTYTVKVAVMLQGETTYGAYGNNCNVTLTSPATQLEPASCGVVNVNINTNIWANHVTGAQGYRFRISGNNTGASGWTNNVYILDRTSRDFKFNMVPGVIWTQTYSVQVAVALQPGIYGAFGPACNVTLEAPITQLDATSCGVTGVLLNTLNRANIVSGAPGYRFRIIGNNSGATGWNGNVYILNRPNRDLRFNMFPGAIAGQTYTVEVAVLYQNGTTYGAYGPVCTVTLSNTLAQQLSQDHNMEIRFDAFASHNPFTDYFGLQVINDQIDEWVSVTIYDMSGKQMEQQKFAPLDIENVQFGKGLASGMYLIEVRQGSNQTMIRQVKN